jgi:hypothetical protein
MVESRRLQQDEQERLLDSSGLSASSLELEGRRWRDRESNEKPTRFGVLGKLPWRRACPDLIAISVGKFNPVWWWQHALIFVLAVARQRYHRLAAFPACCPQSTLWKVSWTWPQQLCSNT